MDTVTLGRTGLKVTVAGLGCGGFSRLGIEKYGLGHAAGIVKTAYGAGVNFFDTAAAYGTEGAVGHGLAGIPRDGYILSTKFPYGSFKSGGDGVDWRRGAADRLARSLDNSLRELRADYVDIYHLHGVKPEDLADARDILVPEMLKAKERGKLRFLGVTEQFGSDTSHAMLKEALSEDCFDVIMAGYNIINPSAALYVLPKAAELNVGVLCMFAVRTALSNPEQLAADISRIIEKGQAGVGLRAAADALDFLINSTPADGSDRNIGGTPADGSDRNIGGAPADGSDRYINGAPADGSDRYIGAAPASAPPAASTIMEAAYRFCRHTPQIHVTLTGTGDAGHLRDNLRSIGMPPLPKDALDRLRALFGRSDCVSGQ